jgi:cell wall-associated NlpC family hydrolase
MAKGVPVRDTRARSLPVLAAAAALLGIGGGGSIAALQATPRPARSFAAMGFPGTGPGGVAAGSGITPLPGSARLTTLSVPAVQLGSAGAGTVAPLRHLLQADMIVVGRSSLPRGSLAAIRRLPGVTAAQSLDAARIRVNGKYAAVLGVDPSTFRGYAARETAASDKLWQDVADGAIAVSYTMGQLDRLPLGGTVSVTGRRRENLRVAGFGTVGIDGVDAVVSGAVARSLGMPAGNAIVISAPHADLVSLASAVRRVVPRPAAVRPLVTQVTAGLPPGSAGTAVGEVTGTPGAAVMAGASRAAGALLTQVQAVSMLRAALSRLGMPYVWGGDGPTTFDCSGLVQWSFAQAGISMPRVAADQARTGPAVPLSQLQPGDLLFYRTDPTDPGYISHVAIYLGNGKMIQAPEPGMDVEVVPAATGPEFAGAIRVDPAIAAAVAASA